MRTSPSASLAQRAELPYASAMTKLERVAALVFAAASPLFILQGRALAQGATPATSTSASAAFPSEGPTPTAPTPSLDPVPVNAPPPPPPSPPPPPPAYPEPTPYAVQSSNAEPGGYPPPPPQRPDEGFQRPEISVRIDPFNFLLEGRLGLEIESQLYKSLTLELVPVFVTTEQPPTLNYSSYEKSSLRQKSNGLGAISGAAIDAGVWFGGKPFQGYVFRAGFTNYAYTYESSFGSPTQHDSVSHTDRQFFAMIGSQNRWGPFTIAGGIGLAYELNKQNRCLDELYAETPCDGDHLEIRLTQSGDKYDLHPFLYPFDLLARFSLGVVF